MLHPFKGPVVIFWCFFGWKHRPNWTLPQEDSQMWQKELITILSKPLTCISNIESNFVLCHIFFKTCNDFLGGFLGEKIVKSKQNLKNIAKYDKLSFSTNNFVKNLILYFKQQNKLSDATPFSERCDDFLMVFWMEKSKKVNITLEIFENLLRTT